MNLLILKKIKKWLNKFSKKIDLIFLSTKDLNFNLNVLNLQNHLLNDKEPGITSQQYCDKQVIISLTSFGKRLEDVWMTIESLMQQTARANKIILWLDKEVDLSNLPFSLKLQMKRGLEIKIYEPDIRSYKKLIPTLLSYPEDIIITVDDDNIYDFNFIEKLIRSYIANPTMIHAARTHVIKLKQDGSIDKYGNWAICSAETDNKKLLFLTGVGGVLYPPHSLDNEVFNETVFKDICPSADDVWFNAMALKKGTPIYKVKTRTDTGDDYVCNMAVQDEALSILNTGEIAMNDPQIQKVYQKYNLLNELNK